MAEKTNQATPGLQLRELTDDIFMGVSQIHSLCYAAQELLQGEFSSSDEDLVRLVDHVLDLLKISNEKSHALKLRLDI